MTNNADLVLPVLSDEPEPRRRVETDTAAAIATSLIGSVSLVVCAVALTRVYLEPLGQGPVVVAGAVTGLLVTAFLAGGAWAWWHDRRSSVD